jgi:hypothetical protein
VVSLTLRPLAVVEGPARSMAAQTGGSRPVEDAIEHLIAAAHPAAGTAGEHLRAPERAASLGWSALNHRVLHCSL